MSPLLSVIIPTQNRTESLVKSVDALLDQVDDVDRQVEIVIVDDGSTECVGPLLRDLAVLRGCEDLIRVFSQAPQGPATARNLGIREAKGELVLFLGDDIYALPGLLQSHVWAHTKEYSDSCYAVLGMADLPPELCGTPFVRWWQRWNFRFSLLLEGKRTPDYSFFYTNNLSLKRAFLLQHGTFDESFRYAAYEDAELGCRLEQQGMRLVFKPEAKADHYHEIDLHSACQRMMTRGKAYDLFVEKTGMLGLSQIWTAIGSGPWMIPVFIRPLFKLACWSQRRIAIGLVNILVLMYCFHVGRGTRHPIPEMFRENLE